MIVISRIQIHVQMPNYMCIDPLKMRRPTPPISY